MTCNWVGCAGAAQGQSSTPFNSLKEMIIAVIAMKGIMLYGILVHVIPGTWPVSSPALRFELARQCLHSLTLSWVHECQSVLLQYYAYSGKTVAYNAKS